MPETSTQFATLDAVIEHYARCTPEALVAVDGDVRYDFYQLNRAINGYCDWFDALGITAGDRVALLAAPGVAYLLTLMAVSRLGAIYVGVNPRYSVDEIAHVVATTDPKILLHAQVPNDDELAERAKSAAGQVDVLPVPDFSAFGVDAAPRKSPAAPGDIAVIVFTSGSMGRPKGAALHHGGLIDAALAQHDHIDGAPRRYISNLPINHVGAIMNTTLGCLVGGGSLVFQAKFDPAAVLGLIESEKIETWLQVPAMFTLAVNHPDFGNTDLSSLKTICIGGGAVSAPTLEHLRSTSAKIFVEYGQTEIMSTLAYSDEDSSDEVLLNTIGRFDPRFEARIADADGRICEPGEVGEIQVRGNAVLRCYWGDEAATRDAFTPDGWLKTGDLAMQRPDGNVSIKGRLREMIKSGGYNVYPREVEAVIETHPSVAEVVVYGVADDIYGEAVHCAVECKPGRTVSAEILKQHCTGALANYKIPKTFKVVSALPRLNNGKIDRASIRRNQLDA